MIKRTPNTGISDPESQGTILNSHKIEDHLRCIYLQLKPKLLNLHCEKINFTLLYLSETVLIVLIVWSEEKIGKYSGIYGFAA